MPPRNTTGEARLKRPRANPDRSDRCHVRIVESRSGVTECRTQARGKTVRTEVWTLFTSREQFEARAANDPLRFADPLQFGRIKAEADDAFERRT